MDRSRVTGTIALGLAAVGFTLFNWDRISLDTTIHGIDTGAIYRARDIAVLQTFCATSYAISHIKFVRVTFYVLCALTIKLIETDIRVLTKFTLGVPLAYYVLAGVSVIVTIGAIISVIVRYQGAATTSPNP